ncbi:MAG: class I SAM-dependent methyltransferase [Erysipelotrichaceae bacterium]|jgi:methylase of polypeptide subunit release factors|nr:class I SAM-dependent methyltransferase [Erysipelotrichaceae bacterium]
MAKVHITTLAHTWALAYLHPETIALDATCGQGNDTLFLSKHAKTVYALDIQSEALEAAKKRCIDCSNILYHQKDHSLVDTLALPPLDLVMFNLGYLPKSDHQITTKPETTAIAIQKAALLLKQGGALLITSYLHDQGSERDAVLKTLLSIPKLAITRSYRNDSLASPLLLEAVKVFK